MTDDPHEQAMVRYETLHGHFGRQQRQDLLTAQRQATERKPSKHPIGRDSNPAEEQTTAPNRAAVKTCIRAYYAGTLSDQINQHKDAATGVALADRFVSLLEIGTSLKVLGMRRPDMEYLLERVYRDNWTVLEVCQAEHYSQATYYRREIEAVDSLIGVIFVDYVE